MLGVLTGLKAEAKIYSDFTPGTLVEYGSATKEGTLAAIERLRARGATRILSFGCAGGLGSEVNVGDIIAPKNIYVRGKLVPVSPNLRHPYTRGSDAVFWEGDMVHSDKILRTKEEKAALFKKSKKCLAVDMESGILARSGMPFAVLRVICDDCKTDLPKAACIPLKAGKPNLPKILLSVLLNPFQIPALIRVGKQAKLAQHAMKEYLASLHTIERAKD